MSKKLNTCGTTHESYLRAIYSPMYLKADEPYDFSSGIVLIGDIDAYDYEKGGCRYRLRPISGLSLSLEGYIGKRIGIKGIATDQFADKDGISHLIQILQVDEIYNHWYPDAQIKKDAESHRARLSRTLDDSFQKRSIPPCPRCGGYFPDKPLQTIVIIDAERYEKLMCSCLQSPPSEQSGITFTQEQLHAAWEQMEHERNEDARRARRMLKWICGQTGINQKDGSFSSIGSVTRISPFTTTYHFTFTYQTYGPYINDFVRAFARCSWARHVKGDFSGPIYEADTPEGTYEVHFSYFDNHSSGW